MQDTNTILFLMLLSSIIIALLAQLIPGKHVPTIGTLLPAITFFVWAIHGTLCLA